MAAPRFAPVSPVDDPRSYASPDHVPVGWVANRPGDIRGAQPVGDRLGSQGPDQGYALLLAERLRDRLVVSPGEDVDDAIGGCLGIALRRASLHGRAPVIHDVTVAFTIWGVLDATPPADLVELRRREFQGLAHVAHHYDHARQLVDRVPEGTLRMTPDQVAAAYPGRWRELVGV